MPRKMLRKYFSVPLFMYFAQNFTVQDDHSYNPPRNLVKKKRPEYLLLYNNIFDLILYYWSIEVFFLFHFTVFCLYYLYVIDTFKDRKPVLLIQCFLYKIMMIFY